MLDSFGAGQAPDAEKFGDKGASTIKAAAASEMFHLTEMGKMGLFNIDGIDAGNPVNDPSAAHMKLRELSVGKDTTTGHFEIAGIVSKTPFPTYPNGFPKEIIEKFEAVVDIVYNPTETEILRKARSLGKISIGGLYMLVGQAVKAEEIFHQVEIDKEIINVIYNELKKEF